MTIDSLRRVMWRLRRYSKGQEHPTYVMLRKAIMFECGTCSATYKSNARALRQLGWIKKYNSSKMTITNKDLNES